MNFGAFLQAYATLLVNYEKGEKRPLLTPNLKFDEFCLQSLDDRGNLTANFLKQRFRRPTSKSTKKEPTERLFAPKEQFNYSQNLST